MQTAFALNCVWRHKNGEFFSRVTTHSCYGVDGIWSGYYAVGKTFRQLRNQHTLTRLATRLVLMKAMISKSPWGLGATQPTLPILNRSLSTEVCVIGAGISGLTTAYLLAHEGKKVVVIDDGPIGGGETYATSAHLCNALDNRFRVLERYHGVAGSRLAAESHTAAIDQIEEIVKRERIKCNFKRGDGYLFEPPKHDVKLLDLELAAAHRAGLTGVKLVPKTPLPFDAGPALRFPNQAEFEPLKYLFALAERFVELGGNIFISTHAKEIRNKKPLQVATDQGAIIDADSVVVATNSPINVRLAIHTKQTAYRTYVIGVAVPRGYVPRALYWDDDNPYHYLRIVERPNEDLDLLLVGGEDRRTGQDLGREPFATLETWMRERFLRAGAVEYSWSGQVMEPVDGVAYIGRSPAEGPNVYLITGDSGNGLTHGTLGAMLIRDLICGRSNPWEKLYDPHRISLLASATFAKENLNTASQYLDLVTAGEVKSLDEIPQGEGAILREGLHKLACYRDPAGKMHIRSATCPHLEGIVRWNAAEKSWDCPCHGSRFDCDGKVLNGPANSNLNPVKPEVIKDLPSHKATKLARIQKQTSTNPMPLKPGSSQKTVSQNIRELHGGPQFERTRKKFGAKKANAQAEAIALSQARKPHGRPKA